MKRRGVQPSLIGALNRLHMKEQTAPLLYHGKNGKKARNMLSLLMALLRLLHIIPKGRLREMVVDMEDSLSENRAARSWY
jgi:hypothetical protein